MVTRALDSLTYLTRSSPPHVDTVRTEQHHRSLFFDSEEFGGLISKVFAHLAIPPTNLGRPAPGVFLLHGGGGRAFPEWATM